MNQIRGIIGIPSTIWLPASFFDSYLNMVQPKGTQTLRLTGVRTDLARNQIVEATLKTKAQWLFFMDSDMDFPSRALIRLLRHDVDIVGGLYFLREPPFNPVAYRVDEQASREKGGHYYSWIAQEVLDYLNEHRHDAPVTGSGCREIPKDGKELRQVDGIGTGCMLIRRRVLEKVPPPWFSYSEGGSEDLFFCRRAIEAGFKVHVDLGVICGHLHQMRVSYQHFMAHLRMVESAEGIGGRGEVER